MTTIAQSELFGVELPSLVLSFVVDRLETASSLAGFDVPTELSSERARLGIVHVRSFGLFCPPIKFPWSPATFPPFKLLSLEFVELVEDVAACDEGTGSVESD